MDLFHSSEGPNRNLLPHDGEINYYGPILSLAEANHYLACLLSDIAWQHDEVIIYGKRIVTARKIAWYGEQAFEYTYSKTTKTGLPWTPELLQLKQRIEQVCGHSFNTCLLNLYHNGSEGMAWHSDAEKDLQKNGAIASLSFGAERKFAFKHKQTKQTLSLPLEHGSLLIMKGSTQRHWLHRLPPTKTVAQPRVNLTFRTIVPGQLNKL